jgi:cell division protein FtsW
VGKGVNGARRWMPLGVMNFQPSELAKLAVLLYAADYMVRKMDVKERFFRAVLPMAVAWRWSACCCWPSPTWAPSW